MKNEKETAAPVQPEKSTKKYETPRDIENAVLWFSAEFAALTTHAQRVKKAIELRKELVDKYENTTVRSYLTRYRKAIKEQKPPRISEIFKSLKLPKKDNDKINTAYKNAVEKRTEKGELIELTPETVAAAISKATEFLSGGQYKMLAGLALLTGRRTAEIGLTGEFAPVKGDENAALFSGQLKTKGEKVKPYKIPLLAPYSAIKAAHDALKAKLQWSETATPDTANRRLSKDLGETIKQHFAAFFGEGIAPHDLRKAYAAITYKRSGEKASFRTFAAAALGHAGGNTLTTETYYKYTVLD